MEKLKLMCVLAHPDDESLGTGGTLAKYAAEGVETYLVTATRGERGRFGDGGERPAPDVVGRTREAELRAAAKELGVREVVVLGYPDGALDRGDPASRAARRSRVTCAASGRRSSSRSVRTARTVIPITSPSRS